MVAKSETLRANLEDIRAFLAVVDFGSISKAAAELGETKGSTSRRITRLEKQMGVRLLARTARAVTPSNEGRVFYDKATASLSILDDVAQEVRKSKSELRGPIRVTAPIDVAIEVLPGIITDFRALHSGITVDMIATDSVLDMTAHRIDLALRIGRGRLPDTSMQAPLVAHMTGGAYASPKYLEERGRPETPTKLMSHDLLLPRGGPGLSNIELVSGSRKVAIRARPVIRASDFVCLTRLAAEGAGIAFLPNILTRRLVMDGFLRRLLPSWSIRGYTLHAVSATGPLLPERVRALRDHIARSIAKDVSRSADT